MHRAITLEVDQGEEEQEDLGEVVTLVGVAEEVEEAHLHREEVEEEITMEDLKEHHKKIATPWLQEGRQVNTAVVGVVGLMEEAVLEEEEVAQNRQAHTEGVGLPGVEAIISNNRAQGVDLGGSMGVGAAVEGREVDSPSLEEAALHLPHLIVDLPTRDNANYCSNLYA